MTAIKDISRYICGGYRVTAPLPASLAESLCVPIETEQHKASPHPFSVANDHNPRAYFPDDWLYTWVNRSTEEREQMADVFGMHRDKLAEASDLFSDHEHLAPYDTFLDLDFARSCVPRFLVESRPERMLIGLGLLHEFVLPFLEQTAPESPQPGHSPVAAGGPHRAIAKGSPLDPNCEILGFQVLQESWGFNSPESLHFDTQPAYDRLGITLNALGLLASEEDASTFCSIANSNFPAAENNTPTPDEPFQWYPWLIVKYEQGNS